MSDFPQETASTSAEHLFPIRAVAQMTGVNPITLRAWERRYGLICPTRTESGHRLYSARDIQAIRQTQTLSAQGIALPQIAQILQNSPPSAELSMTEPTAAQHAAPWVDRFKNATLKLDPLAWRQTEQEALMWLPPETVLANGMLGALRALESRDAWPDRDIGLIWLTQHIRQRLEWWLLLQAKRPDAQHPLILIDTPTSRIWRAEEFALGIGLAHSGTVKILPGGLDESQRHRLAERWQAAHWIRLLDTDSPAPTQFLSGATRLHWCHIGSPQDPLQHAQGLIQGNATACLAHLRPLFLTR
ncbi:MerR family transcriptional regulator [Halothiobacillus sp. DCM-1]|uniref:MerR family transcriptional regulator n=1 Tax=Halothiobacillus sp. DCM-1 TaxID=3112558 RepID=UPI0032549FDD